MTFSSLRKRRTTRRAPKTSRGRTASSTAALLLLAAAAPAAAQAPPPAVPARPSARTYTFEKPAAVTAAKPVAWQLPGEKPKAAAAVTGLRQVAMMQAPLQAPPEDAQEYTIQLEPPGLERLYRLESEDSLEARIKQEALQRNTPERVNFPDEPVLSKVAFAGREFGPNKVCAEPYYVMYDRLYFQEINAERYGWEIGILQPALSSAAFFKDVLLIPYHVASHPFHKYESSAGYCLPGDPVPLTLYPPELTLTGLGAEAGVVVGLLAVFP